MDKKSITALIKASHPVALKFRDEFNERVKNSPWLPSLFPTNDLHEPAILHDAFTGVGKSTAIIEGNRRHFKLTGRHSKNKRPIIYNCRTRESVAEVFVSTVIILFADTVVPASETTYNRQLSKLCNLRLILGGDREAVMQELDEVITREAPDMVALFYWLFSQFGYEPTIKQFKRDTGIKKNPLTISKDHILFCCTQSVQSILATPSVLEAKPIVACDEVDILNDISFGLLIRRENGMILNTGLPEDEVVQSDDDWKKNGQDLQNLRYLANRGVYKTKIIEHGEGKDYTKRLHFYPNFASSNVAWRIYTSLGLLWLYGVSSSMCIDKQPMVYKFCPQNEKVMPLHLAHADDGLKCAIITEISNLSTHRQALRVLKSAENVERFEKWSLTGTALFCSSSEACRAYIEGKYGGKIPAVTSDCRATNQYRNLKVLYRSGASMYPAEEYTEKHLPRFSGDLQAFKYAYAYEKVAAANQCEMRIRGRKGLPYAVFSPRELTTALDLALEVRTEADLPAVAEAFYKGTETK